MIKTQLQISQMQRFFVSYKNFVILHFTTQDFQKFSNSTVFLARCCKIYNFLHLFAMRLQTLQNLQIMVINAVFVNTVCKNTEWFRLFRWSFLLTTRIHRVLAQLLQIIAIFCKFCNFCGCRTLFSCDYFLSYEFSDVLLAVAILINVAVLANRLLKIVRLAIFATAPYHGHKSDVVPKSTGSTHIL